MSDSPWTEHFLLPDLFLNANLGCPAGRTILLFQNSQQKKQHAQRKKKSPIIKQFRVSWLYREKKKSHTLAFFKRWLSFCNPLGCRKKAMLWP